MKRHFVLLLFISFAGMAQKKTSPRWHYRGVVQAGFTTGSSSLSYLLQTIQGVEKNNWFTGAALGYDNYGMPGFPILIHAQKSFNAHRNRPFAYAQTGAFLPNKKGSWNDKSWNNQPLYDLKKGFMAEAGVSYLLALGKSAKKSLVLSAGYSYKMCRATAYTYIWDDFPPYEGSIRAKELQQFYYRRIALKVGFVF